VTLRAQKLEELAVVTKQVKLLLKTCQTFQGHSLEETERWKVLLISFTLSNILIPKWCIFLDSVVMICDYPEGTSQSPNFTWKSCIVSFNQNPFPCLHIFYDLRYCCHVECASALYFFEADNSQTGNHILLPSVSAVRGDIKCTELEQNHCDHKTNGYAPNDLPHLPSLFIERKKEMQNITPL